jgi:hypothetical protein
MLSDEYEIPTVPPGSIKTEQEGDDVFLLLHGKRIAKRGRPGTLKAKGGFRLCRGLIA